MKLEQGKLVMWENDEKKQVVWMVCEDEITGVVIHSDDLMKIGTLSQLDPKLTKPFVGTVNIVSTDNS